VQQSGSWADPAERANSGFADPLNLIQVMLAKGERRVFLRWFYSPPSVDRVKIQTKIVSETVAAVALAYALNLVVIFRLPQGGSVTAVSMVPLLWLALRRGPKVGVLGGMVYGLVDMFPKPYIVHPAQFLLDYPLAFGALGLAGFFKRYPIPGVVAGIAGRFVCHFLSGVIFFWMYAPKGMSPAVYSAIYNGSYLAVELVFSIIVMYALVRRGLIDMRL